MVSEWMRVREACGLLAVLLSATGCGAFFAAGGDGDGDSDSDGSSSESCGGYIPGPPSVNKGRIMTSETPVLVLRRFPDSWEALFPARKAAGLMVDVPALTQTLVGLKIAVPANAREGKYAKLQFIQRHRASRQIVGGVTVQITVGAASGKSR